MKRAVIIGASSGIGHEIAKILLNDGWQIGIAARRSDLLQMLRQKCPERVEVATIDVTDDTAPAMLSELVARLGGMDVFFYVSGIGKQNTLLAEDIELGTVATNALGFARMVGAAFRYMADNGGGHIAAITSVAGTKGLGAAPSYSATKAFQNTYLQALEQLSSMRDLGISFTDVRPGFVATALLGESQHYPLLMQPVSVARHIVSAVLSGRHVVVVDWRWRLVVELWRLIPNCWWRRMCVK